MEGQEMIEVVLALVRVVAKPELVQEVVVAGEE